MRCNRCVSVFDHHCKFVNNCVGQINYTCFIKLILSVELYECLLLIMCIITLIYKRNSFTLVDIPILVALLKSLLVFTSNGYLICFHVMIRSRDLTTFEYISNRYKLRRTVSPSNAEEHNHSINKEKETTLILNG